MSQNPHGYGQWPTQSQPSAQQYGYPPPSHSSPIHGVVQSASSFESHYKVTQGSFDHNANNIPGLGITGPSPGSDGRHAGPVGGWGQISTAPSYAPDHHPIPYGGQNQSHLLHPRPSQVLHHKAQHHAPLSNESQAREQDDDIEEGELDEDYFDDLYEPTEPADIATTARHGSNLAVDVGTSRELSVVDAQDDAFYEDESGEINSDTNGASISYPADDEEAGPSDRHPKSKHVGRERSGSYSPYLSPREIHHDDDASEGSKGRGRTERHPKKTVGISPTHDARDQTSIKKRQNQADELPQENHTATDAAALNAAAANERLLKSIDEGKKEARKSILRLVPYGVKYRTYIDEGFDENLVKSLFTDLGINPSITSATDPGSKKSSQVAPAQKQLSPPPKPSAQNSSTTPGDQSEERKDRIARLLAMKKSKPSSSETAPPVSPEPPKPAQEKPKSQKELLLQKRLEALRKARESKAADQSKTPQDSLKPDIVAKDVSSKSQKSQSATVIGQSKPPGDGVQDNTAPKSLAGSLPQQTGLSTAEQVQLAMSSRKRPVAADFVDYPSTGGSLKRPFGQARHDSSLVIDVSDASDEEDVEMEMESPTEDQVSLLQRPGSPSRRGPLIRDFPPLSDFSQRNYASSTSSIPTPPNGVNNGASKAKGDVYSKKMLEIEAMKRKIAEAEARTVRKTPARVQTPNIGTPSASLDSEIPKPSIRRVQSLGDADKPKGSPIQANPKAVSMKLPKPSEMRGVVRAYSHDRRVRIASVELPTVEATLQEKRGKLRFLQDKVTQLEAEIAEASAKKQLLTDEMDGIVDEATADDIQPQTSSAHSTKTSPLPSQSDPAPPVVSTLQHSSSSSALNGMDQQLGGGASDGRGPEVALEHKLPIIDSTAKLPVSEPTSKANMSGKSIQQTSGDKHPGVDAMVVDETDNNNEPREPTRPVDDSTASVAEINTSLVAQVTADTDLDHVALDSSSSSPSPADAWSSHLRSKDGTDRQDGKADAAAIPVQISHEAVRATSSEEEVAATREAGHVMTAAGSSFTPYKSPLQYFRSYRFHPQFKDAVGGGLKSLTYSGKIEPKTMLCPSELDEQDCTDRELCPYQHFSSMMAKDDQILVELGKSDDFTGEQKTRFVQGLREVLQRFRSEKVRDFNTIAYGIIDFRRRFLGDESKILSHLEGVTI